MAPTIFVGVNKLSSLLNHIAFNHIVNPTIPLVCFDQDHDVDCVSPAYEAWEVQDQMFLTWFQ